MPTPKYKMFTYMAKVSDEFICTMVFLETEELEEWARFKADILTDEYLDIASVPFLKTMYASTLQELEYWAEFKREFLTDPRWDNYPDEKIRMQVELDTLDFEIWKRKMVPVLKSIRAKAVPELDLFALLGL